MAGERIVVITGSASGIGPVITCARRGREVVTGVDLANADVQVDLSAPAVPEILVASVRALAPEGIDGIVAYAGVSKRTPWPRNRCRRHHDDREVHRPRYRGDVL